MSNLTAFAMIPEGSEATPGLFNRVFSQLSDNIQTAGSGQFSLGPRITANSNTTNYLFLTDSSHQRSNYVIGSQVGGTADGLNIWDDSGQTMIASFSKQSIRFYQSVVGPVFDVGGALADTLNAATYGTASDSDESRIQAAISDATAQGISRVYVPASMYPYSAGSISFSTRVQMVREGGDWGSYDVRAYGAYGDGIHDDGVAAYSCVNAAPDGSIIRFPSPSSVYKFASNVTVLNRTGLQFASSGGLAPIVLSGQSRTGFLLSGMNQNLRFEYLKFTGSGITHEANRGIATLISPPSGTTTIGLIIQNCEAAFVTAGFYVDVAIVDDASDLAFIQNYVHDIVGVDSGQGYGIAATAFGLLALGNRFDKCQRHSLYMSLCHNFRIIGNRFYRHRLAVADGSVRGACELARCYDGSAVANTFLTCADTAMSIEPSEDPSVTHLDSRGISVTGNIFRDSSTMDIHLGIDSSIVTKHLSHVAVVGNTIYRPSSATNNTPSVYVHNGKHLQITNNAFYADNSYSVQYSLVYLAGAGGQPETDHVAIKDNQALLSTNGLVSASFVEVGTSVSTGTQRITVGPNDVEITGGAGSNAHVFFDASQTNRSIEHPQPNMTYDLAYSASMTPAMDNGRRGRISVLNTSAFTINDFLQRAIGRTMELDIKNSSGGVMGTVGFGASYLLAGAFVPPANGKRRIYAFYDDGASFIETYRSPQDM